VGHQERPALLELLVKLDPPEILDRLVRPGLRDNRDHLGHRDLLELQGQVELAGHREPPGLRAQLGPQDLQEAVD
jgi:hypothetical protein